MGASGQSQGGRGRRSVARSGFGCFLQATGPLTGSGVWPRPGSGMSGRAAFSADRLLIPVPLGGGFQANQLSRGNHRPLAGGLAGWVNALPFRVRGMEGRPAGTCPGTERSEPRSGPARRETPSRSFLIGCPCGIRVHALFPRTSRTTVRLRPGVVVARGTNVSFWEKAAERAE